jgi:hypothetical protein
MAREQSLNDPLSGEEIKQIILQEIEAKMDSNCTLVNDITYPGFTVNYSVNIGFIRSPTKQTLVWGGANLGDTSLASHYDAHDGIVGEYQTDSPNGARQEHDLPTPVLVQTPDGPKRRKVKFQRKVKRAKSSV